MNHFMFLQYTYLILYFTKGKPFSLSGHFFVVHCCFLLFVCCCFKSALKMHSFNIFSFFGSRERGWRVIFGEDRKHKRIVILTINAVIKPKV